MISGTQRAAPPLENEGFPANEAAVDPLPMLPPEEMTASFERPRHRSGGQRWLGAALALAAAGWIGFSIWAHMEAAAPVDGIRLIEWTALASLPLMLLGILWIMFGQTPRREAEKFTLAVERMREESRGLEAVLQSVAERLESNQTRLGEEADRLMTLGDEAADRLGRVTHYLSRQSSALDQHAGALEAAAANARVDLGVLLHDLPRAEEQARSMAGALRDTGMEAHQQAGALAGQLSALVARGREADDVLGAAAQRLGAHLARIESSAAAATERLDEAAIGMTAAVDGTMARASEAIDHARSSLDAQGAAMLATIDQGKAALGEAGDEASRRLEARIIAIRGALDTFGEQLGGQDALATEMARRISADIAALEDQFARLRDAGGSGAERLNESFSAVRVVAEGLHGELSAGHDRAGELIDRMQTIALAIQEASAALEGRLPEALSQVGALAETTGAAAEGIAAEVTAAAEASDRSARSLAEAEASGTRHSAAMAAMSARLGDDLAALAERLDALRGSGMDGALALGAAFDAARGRADAAVNTLIGGTEGVEAFSGRVASLAERLSEITGRLDSDVPAALARIEAGAAEAGRSADALTPQMEAIGAVADAAVASLAAAEASAKRQRDDIDALLVRLSEGAAAVESQLRAVEAATVDADRSAGRLAGETSRTLVEALLRVRETAAQAADRAREAIEAVIPASAKAMADASRDAVTRAVSGPVEAQMDEVVKVAGAAVDAARAASERLTRQLLTIGEAAAAVEERIAAAREADEERESETLSRHVALLIESLNSTAIDVTKILSNDVTDSAWAAYLKGDRGVFTRRAVRLLDSGEAREILRHYEEEPDFREHANRYIHDFETMMRRILADRDGSAIGVTILSSDMGKLYVALAQAIDRLRR